MSKSIWPKIPSKFVSSMLAGHSALGLAFAALMYVLCISGTLLVLTDEMVRWDNPDTPLVVSATPETLAKAVDAGIAVAAEHGTNDYVVVSAPTPATPYINVRFVDFTTGFEKHYLADADGNLVSERREGVQHFLEHLHIYLHMPRTMGLFLVGLSGVALLASVVSGVFSHPRIFRDAFSFRRGGSRRTQEADFHNRLSVWGLPFHLVVPLTGALLGLSTLILGVLAMAAFDGDMERARSVVAGPSIMADDTPVDTETPNVPALTALLEEHPDATLSRIGLRRIGTEGQSLMFALSMPDDLTLTEQYTYDVRGEFVGVRGFADGPVGAQVVAALGPLHFGWFGGWPVKVLYVALGLGLTAIISSGVAIWAARRDDKGRAVPRWLNAWYGLVWGQPIIYTLIAGFFLFGIHPPDVALYVVLTLLSVLPGLTTLSGLLISRLMRLCLSVLLIALVVSHVVLWGIIPDDLIATVLNVALLATAGLLITSVRAFPFRRAEPLIQRNVAPGE